MSDSEGEPEVDEENEDTELGDEEGQLGDEEGDDEEKLDEEEGSKGSVIEKPKKQIPKDTPLTIDHIKQGISMLCKTGDGLEIAYVKLVAQNHGVTNVFILSTYIHLRYVDLSNNKLNSLSPLQNMRFLVSLKVANNMLTSPELFNFPFLQYLDLSGNPIKSTKGIKQQSLEKLKISKTPLQSLEDMTAENLPSLTQLVITQNALKTLEGLALPTLKTVYAAGNKIKSLAGITRLTSLARLHLRDNRIKRLNGLKEDLPSLTYLNIRGNAVEEAEQLHHLTKLPNLQTLVLTDNPLADESDDYRLDVLMYGRHVERIDKDPVEPDEIDEATELYPQREEERLMAERERGGGPSSEDTETEDEEGEEEGEEKAEDGDDEEAEEDEDE